MAKKLNSFFLAAMMIPTTDLKDWKLEQFSDTPKNEISASSNGILVKVKSSAGPLIYPLKAATQVKGFKIKGQFLSLPQFKDMSLQGEKKNDDYPLRIGFVIPGDKKLSGIKRLFAPQWIKNLYQQAPTGMGIESVQFFNITQNPAQVGKSRTHPALKLIKENFFAEVKAPGPFVFEHSLTEPIEAVAVWISIDGDDTKSDFEVLISELEILIDR
jgi:hypothetical protein